MLKILYGVYIYIDLMADMNGIWTVYGIYNAIYLMVFNGSYLIN